MFGSEQEGGEGSTDAGAAVTTKSQPASFFFLGALPLRGGSRRPGRRCACTAAAVAWPPLAGSSVAPARRQWRRPRSPAAANADAAAAHAAVSWWVGGHWVLPQKASLAAAAPSVDRHPVEPRPRTLRTSGHSLPSPPHFPRLVSTAPAASLARHSAISPEVRLPSSSGQRRGVGRRCACKGRQPLHYRVEAVLYRMQCCGYVLA